MDVDVPDIIETKGKDMYVLTNDERGCEQVGRCGHRVRTSRVFFFLRVT